MEFLPQEGEDLAEEIQPQEQPPQGLPHLDTSGTSVQGDPYSLVAPGGLDPEEDVPDDVVQAYQEDFVARAMMFMSDNRQQDGMSSTPADAVMNRLNLKGARAPEAIGSTAAEIVMMIKNNAKQQGVEYPTPAIMGAGMEIVQLLMDLSRDGGVFPDIPENEDDPGYEEIATTALLEATKTYGERMLQTGQVNQEEYSKMLGEMMEEEAALGELDDWDPSQMMGPEAMNNLINRGVGLAQQKAAKQQPPPEQEV